MSLVADPTTGVPSKQEISYIAVERTALENDVTVAEEAEVQANLTVTNLEEQLTNAHEDATAKAAALETCKSNVSEWDSIAATQATVDSGTAGDGSETETDVEDASEPQF